MIIFSIVIGVIFFGGAVVIGVIVGNQNRPITIDSGVGPSEDCEKACQLWQIRRQETCQLKQQTQEFQSRVDSTASKLLTAVAVHLALAAAAAAAAFIPIAGPYIAVVIGAAALEALAYAHALAGQLAAQSSNLADAQRIQGKAAQREEDARMNITKACSMDRAIQCFSIAAPC